MSQRELLYQIADEIEENRLHMLLTKSENARLRVIVELLEAHQPVSAYSQLIQLPTHIQEEISDSVWHWLEKVADEAIA